MKEELIIVEDNPMYRELLVSYFQRESAYQVRAFASAEGCLAAVQRPPAAFLLDQDLDPLRSRAMTGLELLQRLRARGLAAPALFLTGHKAVQPAVEILKGGAFAYMRKEIADLEKVKHKVQQMVAWQGASRQVEVVRRKAARQRRNTALLLALLVGVLGVLWMLA